MFKTEKKYYKNAFLYALVMAVILLAPFVIIDGGYMIYYGDYNAQQIPFYKTCIEAVHSGNFGWNWQTDLGANFIGSYSFYTLGSPFFWFAALFPAEISQYLMAPLLAVKIALASLFAFMYIRRFVSKPQTALIGGLLYAFSGYSMYNIFFNHFHEALLFFPLLLIGLEEAVVNKRRGVFALAVALNAFVNYFFFIGECVFLSIYFIIRLAVSKEFNIRARDFLCLAFESVTGVLIAGILFVPSIFQVLGVPRSTSMLNGWNFLFYGTEQRYGLILESMFFPPEIPARTSMFENANSKWSSVAAYLPLFSMAGVIAFVKYTKKHWAKVLLPVCLFFALVPGLNASFVLFNYSFYTRWFYMPELICCLVTVYALEHEEIDLKFGFRACTVIVSVMSALVLFFPMEKTEEITLEDGGKEKVTSIVPRLLNDMSPAVYVTIGLAALFLAVLYLLLQRRENSSREAFIKRTTAVAMGSCLLLGYYFVGYGRIIGPSVGDYNRTVSADIKIDDPDFYRMEAYNEINNVNMLWGMSSLKSFTSIIPDSTFDLYKLMDYDRSVNSAPDEEYYALRSLTRVKYYFIRNDRKGEKSKTAIENLKTFEYRETQGEYDIYENKYAFPMGFSYDNYVLEDDVSKGDYVDKLMARAVILSSEQAEKYSDILKELPEDMIKNASYDQFIEDAGDRINSGVTRFSVNRNGFTAAANYDRGRLVMFSVPYDDGWSAEINGVPTEIEKVNGGFMAVRVNAGESDISFSYKTPGLGLGIICSAAGTAVFGIYMFIFHKLRYKPVRYAHRYVVEGDSAVKGHNSYIGRITEEIRNCPENKKNNDSSGRKINFPEIEEYFMDRKIYDFTKRRPKPRQSHLTEDDEAYRVMQELDSEKKDDF